MRGHLRTLGPQAQLPKDLFGQDWGHKRAPRDDPYKLATGLPAPGWRGACAAFDGAVQTYGRPGGLRDHSMPLSNLEEALWAAM